VNGVRVDTARESVPQTWFVGGWLVLALLALRAVILLLGPGILNGDGFLYVGAAQHLLQYGQMPPATAQSRSFSVLLAPVIAALGHDAIWNPVPYRRLGQPIADAMHVVQVLFDLGLVALLMHFYRQIGPRNRWAYLVGLVAIALQPITASWTNFVVPDSLATFGLFVGLYLLAMAAVGATVWRLALGGLLTGVAAFLRIDLVPLIALLLVPWCLLLVLRLRRNALVGTALALALFAAPILGMMALQYASQGEARYVNSGAKDNPNNAKPGYFAWTRAWLMTPREFHDFAFAEAMPGWRGFAIENYPARAFVDAADRANVAAALRAWQTDGYTPAVDARLSAAGARLRAIRPLQAWVTAPTVRTVQLWANPDGGAALTAIFGLSPPPIVSLVVAAAVLLLKLVIGLFALIAAWVLVRPVVASRFVLDSILDWPRGFGRLSLAAFLGRLAEMWGLNLLYGGGVMESRFVIEIWPCLIVLAAFGYRAMASRFTRTSALRPERQAELEPIGPMETVQ
jgi:hypothetical protein